MIAGCSAGSTHRTAVSTTGLFPATSGSSTTTTAAPSLLPPPGANVSGQTRDEPLTSTPIFQAEMAALWQAVQTGDPTVANPVFFPEQAYLQVKAVSNPAADYQNRLLAHFELDLAAAHRLIGAGRGAGAGAQLLTVLVPTATWIPPGHCANRLGYWHMPGARIVYQQAGATHSFGIASLISWRGYWYVVHLGSVQPPANQGVVDAPAAGNGVFTPTGGC